MLTFMQSWKATLSFYTFLDWRVSLTGFICWFFSRSLGCLGGSPILSSNWVILLEEVIKWHNIYIQGEWREIILMAWFSPKINLFRVKCDENLHFCDQILLKLIRHHRNFFMASKIFFLTDSLVWARQWPKLWGMRRQEGLITQSDTDQQ